MWFIRFFSYGNTVGDDTPDNAKSALSRLQLRGLSDFSVMETLLVTIPRITQKARYPGYNY